MSRYAAAWWPRVAVPVVAAVLCAAPARAQRVETIARVIASSGVEGRFAHPVCAHGMTLRPSDRAAFTYSLMRHARDPDDPLVVDLGGLLTPHGVARYAAQERPSSLAVMVDRLGYDALAFGQTVGTAFSGTAGIRVGYLGRAVGP